jgi:hypothetical protein
MIGAANWETSLMSLNPPAIQNERPNTVDSAFISEGGCSDCSLIHFLLEAATGTMVNTFKYHFNRVKNGG